MASTTNEQSIVFFEPGRFKRLLILGLDPYTLILARLAIALGVKITVLGGPRQAGALDLDGGVLANRLADLGCTVAIVESLAPDLPQLKPEAGTLAFSASSPFIIHKWFLELFKGRVVNSHGAPLPEWRGGGGYTWRILAGDRRGNSLIHLVDNGIDTGDVVFERAYMFPPSARKPIDFMRYGAEQAESLFQDFLVGVFSGATFTLRKQNERGATYFPRIDSERQAYISWLWNGQHIEQFILGFSQPYPGAKTFVRKKPLALYDAAFVPDERFDHPFLWGHVFGEDGGNFAVAVNGGQLLVPRTAARGEVEIRLGDRLHTPSTCLDEALAIRPIYNPLGLKF